MEIIGWMRMPSGGFQPSAGMVLGCLRKDASNCPAKITKSVGKKEFFAVFFPFGECDAFFLRNL
ncbi:MAG: hypothetical protein ACI3YM_01870 [Prevotella sp.]